MEKIDFRPIIDCDIYKKGNDDCLVDLIVLSFNGKATSEEFLKHFIENTDQKKCRLIWIDNGSTDGSVSFLLDKFKEIENCVFVGSSQNQGVINGRNLGWHISHVVYNNKRSKYIMYLDNDQFVYGNWLEHHISVLESGYDMVGVEAWQLNKMFMPSLHISNLNQTFSYVGCGGMLIKREVTDKIGMFDQLFNPAYFEDPDFCFRALDAGFKIGWNIKAKIIHMPHQTLGKMPNVDRNKRLIDSLNKFRQKWKNRQILALRQKDLPQFKE